MKLNVQTQTLDFNTTQPQNDQMFNKQDQKSNNTEHKSEYSSKKDIHLSDLDTNLAPLDDKDLMDFTKMDPKADYRETIKHERRKIETKDASVSANFLPKPEIKIVEKLVRKSSSEDSEREYSKRSSKGRVELEESSDLLYSCVVSYAHNMFSKNQHDREQSVIMRKCLEQGKLNFPDLFLRFID